VYIYIHIYIHIYGKVRVLSLYIVPLPYQDIIWFHSIIWPALLLSAGVPLPKTILAHGFVHGPDGRKMSKSLGNVIDPMELLQRHDVDVFRFFLVRGELTDLCLYLSVCKVDTYLYISSREPG